MSWFARFWKSAIGKKAVMAVTGIILFGFVLAHLLGNLKVYAGADAMNGYGEWLRVIGYPALPNSGALWLMRILLIVAVVLHIWAAWALTRMNRAARPHDYQRRDYAAASYASRTMRWGGVLVLLFVIYHLLHFTTGHAHPDFVYGKPYENLVIGFSIWWVSLFYIIANLALGLHLYHGLWSMFQSLGWNNPRFNAWRRHFATAFAVVITLGNISFPIAVMLGILK